MEYSIEKVGSLKYELKFTVPAATVEDNMMASLQKLRRQVTMPGFRKGKVPIEIVKNRYSKDVEGEVISDLLESTFREIMKSEDYHMIGSGLAKSVDWHPGTDLKAVLEFQVEPEIEIKTIDNLNVIQETHQVTAAMVGQALEQLRERHAVVKAVEDGAQNGHFILADFQELDASGMALIGRKFKDRYFRLGSSIFGKKFDEQLQGTKPGDQQSVEVIYPAKPDENKTEYYRVETKKVENQILPELDDEFAKSVGNYNSLPELRAAVQAQLEKDAAERAELNLHDHLIDELIKNNDFDVPPLMVDTYLNSWFEDLKKETKRELNEEELKNRNRPFAIRNIKWHLLKKKLMEQEKILVSETDIEDAFTRIIQQTKMNISEIRKYYRNSEHHEELVHRLEEQRVLDRLLKTANVQVVDVTQPQSNLIQTV